MKPYEPVLRLCGGRFFHTTLHTASNDTGKVPSSMSLSLMYITKDPVVAAVAQDAGVQRLFVDMEYIGKEERQAGLNSVKSYHTYADIEAIRRVSETGPSDLLVRVNPIHDATKAYCSSEEEIDTAIACGADLLMLPMFRTVGEVDRFLTAVGGRVRTMLLLETREAYEAAEDILSIGGFDEVHIGLNDLHLSYHQHFMFQPLSDGKVDVLAAIMRRRHIFFGFGGVARVGYGDLPAEFVIAEHYRLGSRAAILSRSFCNANFIEDRDELTRIFREGVRNIRICEAEVSAFSPEQFEQNRRIVCERVEQIVQKRRAAH